MFFHKRRAITPLKFSMNNRTIDVVHNFNHLGNMLDANMSWKSHIAMVSNKLSQINGILHRLKYLYPQNILITLYKSYLFFTLTTVRCFGDMLVNQWTKFKRKLSEQLHKVTMLHTLNLF